MINKFLVQNKENFLSFCRRAKKEYPTGLKYLPYVISIIVLLGIYQCAQISDRKAHFYHTQEGINFHGVRVLGNKHIYQRKEAIISKRLNQVESSLQKMSQAIQKVHELMARGEENTQAKKRGNIEDKPLSEDEKEMGQKIDEKKEKPSAPAGSLLPDSGQIRGGLSPYEGIRPHYPSGGLAQMSLEMSRPSTISFPVQLTKKERIGVTVPAGSYLKAKLLTGVEVSESRPVPVLLQADFAFIGPNQTRIDLTGCFMLAKSKGNLSIERVEMQITKLSCVSKKGKMFERTINGFVTDERDSSFGVEGSVNSKQSRVATMAFLSSIVEGIGSAIQQMQGQTLSTSSGSTTAITGDQGKYMLGGGVSNAASLVTSWYLKHAQNLLPTINIGSGQDIWIILQDKVDLPNWYFRQTKAKRDGNYSHLSRLID